MTLRDKAVTGALWQTLNVSFKAVAHLLFLSIMARLLEKETFGAFALISAAILFVTLFSEFGIGAALIQRKENSQRTINVALWTSVSTGLLLYAVLFSIAPLIARFYDNQVGVHAIQVIGVNLILNSIAVVPRSLIIRELNFRKLFLIDSLPLFVANVLVGPVLGILGFELWALIIPTLVVSLLAATMALWLRPLKLTTEWGREELKQIVNFGGMLMFIRLVNFVGGFIDKALLGKLVSFNLLGSYERAQRISLLPDTFLGESLDGVVFSGISRATGADEGRQLFLRPLGLLSLLLFPLAYLLFSYSEIVVDIVLGANWRDAVPLLQIFALALPFRTMTKLSDAYNRAKGLLLQALFAKLLFAGLVGVLTLRFSTNIEEVALSFLAATVVQWCVMMGVFVYKEGVPFRVYGRTVLPGVLVGLAYFAKTVLLNAAFDLGRWQVPILAATDVVLLFAILLFLPSMLGRQNLSTIKIVLTKLPGGSPGRILTGRIRRLLDM